MRRPTSFAGIAEECGAPQQRSAPCIESVVLIRSRFLGKPEPTRVEFDFQMLRAK
jgi:hypothetical protein